MSKYVFLWGRGAEFEDDRDDQKGSRKSTSNNDPLEPVVIFPKSIDQYQYKITVGN